MKTLIMTADIDLIKTGLNNKNGMIFKNTPLIRADIKKEIHNTLRVIQKKKASK